MERRRVLIELIREVVRAGASVESVAREVEKELARALVGDVLKRLEEDIVKSFYEIKTQTQPGIEELKAEIAKAMGLNESGDLLEELRRALRGSESTPSERVRERSSESSERAEEPG